MGAHLLFVGVRHGVGQLVEGIAHLRSRNVCGRILERHMRLRLAVVTLGELAILAACCGRGLQV
jgi:hypothetical protein